MFLTLQKIKRDSENALKEGDSLKVKTLRLFLSAFHNREIELRPKKQELAEEDVYSVLKTEIKKRKEAIEMFEKGKREDLVSQEKKELEILKKYLPAQISDEELKTVVERVKEKTKAQSKADFGKLMGRAMKEVKGRADGQRVKKIVEKIFFPLLIFLCLFIPLAISAQVTEMGASLEELGQEVGFVATPLSVIIGRFVKILISLCGVILVVILVYAGFLWMRSQGDAEKINKAKKMIIAALIGLTIIVFSYAITSFILGALERASGIGLSDGEWGQPGGPAGPGGLPKAAFKITKIVTSHDIGGGIREGDYHQSVFLCSNIQPIFNRLVDKTQIDNLSNLASLKIEKEGTAKTEGQWLTRSNTIIFKQGTLFEANTNYAAYLPKAILDKSGDTLKACSAAGGCLETDTYFLWKFKTGSTVDTVPPEVISYSPQGEENPIYIEIKAYFSEPIDASTVIGEDNLVIPGNISVSELSGQGGEVVSVLAPNFWEVKIDEKNFELKPQGDNLLKIFTWYRVKVENIEDLCQNKMEGEMTWEFRTNDLGKPCLENKDCEKTNCCLNNSCHPEKDCLCHKLHSDQLSCLGDTILGCCWGVEGGCYGPEARECKGGEGYSCDKNLEAEGCQPDDDKCARDKSYFCGADDCKCTKSGNTAGADCRALSCPDNIGDCQTSYQCLVLDGNCRCCCTPGTTNFAGLLCYKNQSPCTGEDRGLYCGCINDNQCGVGNGCGFLDPDKCCFGRPEIISKNPSPGATNVPLNAAVEVKFDQEMDKKSINLTNNLTNIEFKKCGDKDCSSSKSAGIRKIIVSGDRKGFTLYPSANLEKETFYRMTVKGGSNSQGVRSAEGVSMSGTEQWVFETGTKTSGINLIKINPNKATIEIGKSQDYSANAFDNDGFALNVSDFNWSLSRQEIAEVSPSSGLKTSATGVGEGTTQIQAAAQGEIDTGTLTVTKAVISESLKIEESPCNPSRNIYPSPNPGKDYDKACLNIKISARFNKKIKVSTVTEENVFLAECADDQCQPSEASKISGGLTVESYNLSKDRIVFTPASDLSSEKTYQVFIKGRVQGIKGEDDSIMKNDYAWKFKTIDEICTVEKAMVTPVNYSTNEIGKKIDYHAGGLGRDCLELTGAYQWDWTSSDDSVATVGSAVDYSNSNQATTVGYGTTQIQAATRGKTGQGTLKVESKGPPVDPAKYCAEKYSEQKSCEKDSNCCWGNSQCHAAKVNACSDGSGPKIRNPLCSTQCEECDDKMMRCGPACCLQAVGCKTYKCKNGDIVYIGCQQEICKPEEVQCGQVCCVGGCECGGEEGNIRCAGCGYTRKEDCENQSLDYYCCWTVEGKCRSPWFYQKDPDTELKYCPSHYGEEGKLESGSFYIAGERVLGEEQETGGWKANRVGDIRNGEIIFAGQKDGVITLTKVNEKGETTFTTTNLGSYRDASFDSKGNYFVPYNKGNEYSGQVYLQKWDRNDQKVLDKRILSRFISYVSGIAIDSQDNIILCGETDGYSPWVGKYDLDGNLLWSYDDWRACDWWPTYNDVAIDSQDNIIAVGRVQGRRTSHCSGFYQATLTKLDSQGKKIWFKDPYGTSRSDLGSVAVNSEDKILVLAGNGDLKIYSPEGDLQVDQSNFDNGNVDWAWYNGAQGVGKNFFIGGRIRDSIPKPVVYLVDEKSSVLQKDIWSVEGKSQILTIKYDKITKTALAVGQIDWEGKNYLYTKLYK